MEVPISAATHFVQPQVHVTLGNAAKLLGFSNIEEMKKVVVPQLKLFDDAEPLGAVVGAQAFNRLVCLCAGKTAAARRLFEELSSSWKSPGTSKEPRTRQLPAQPLIAGPLPAWPSCSAELVGMEAGPLERVRQYIQWRTRMKHFAGIACGIVRNGSLVYYQDAGFQDAEKKVKMSGDTIIRLFSMTKCLVAAAFMTYLEDAERKIDLDDPVSKYIPSFANMTVLPKRGQKENQPCEKVITLRQLLTHTSGLGYGATLDDPWPPQKGSYYKVYEELSESTKSGSISNLEQWCDALAKIPLKGQPGRYWDYSYSLDVLGRVLEVISGKTLDVVVEERICGPLKMRDTKFKVAKQDAHRIGPWYKSVEIEGKAREAHRLEVVDPGGEESGWVGDNVSPVLSGGGTVEVPLAMKGGMVSTFNDYLRFLVMLRNFGELDGVRVLRKETVQNMICNHIPVACYGKRSVFVFDKPGLGYNCLGQIQGQHGKMDKGGYPGEFGWGGLAGPAWTIDPRSDLIILSMTQTAFVLDHEEYVRYAARRAIHQHIFGSVAAPSKATSYAPEIFDLVSPKALAKNAADEQVQLEQEFVQEHLQFKEKRVRGAKERAICPGPRLYRHPSDEEVREYQQAAARRSTSSPNADEEKENSNNSTPGKGTDDQPPSKRRKGAAVAASPKGKDQPKLNLKMQEASTPSSKQTVPASPGSGSEKQELLFSRVAVGSEQVDKKKARVTAVRGSSIEVITEDSYRAFDVAADQVSVIEETQFGIPVSSFENTGPKDFGHLLSKDKVDGDDKRTSASSPKE